MTACKRGRVRFDRCDRLAISGSTVRFLLGGAGHSGIPIQLHATMHCLTGRELLSSLDSAGCSRRKPRQVTAVLPMTSQTRAAQSPQHVSLWLCVKWNNSDQALNDLYPTGERFECAFLHISRRLPERYDYVCLSGAVATAGYKGGHKVDHVITLTFQLFTCHCI